MKLEDNNLHVFSPSGWWGDQILNLFSIKYCLDKENKDGVIIHTGKRVYNPHLKMYYPADEGIIKFWSTFKFVKGVLFDMDQSSMYEDAKKSNYNWYPFLNESIPEDYKYDLSKDIDFTLFPRSNLALKHDKIAVFQPISLKNKPTELVNHFLCYWDYSIRALKDKGYAIYMIGSREDYFNARELYPELIDDKDIVNLMDKISMFDAINLVMNYASFVLSCCSWSAWYGIASRKKTAFCAGPLIEDGEEDKYVNLMGNKDVFFMDFSSKKQYADSAIANWIS